MVLFPSDEAFADDEGRPFAADSTALANALCGISAFPSILKATKVKVALDCSRVCMLSIFAKSLRRKA